MMRFVFVILAVTGVTRAASNEEVDTLFKEVITLIPKDDVIALFMDYAENDTDIKEMVRQVQIDPSPETLIKRAEIVAPFKDFLRFSDAHGLDLASYATKLLTFVHEMDNYVPNPPQVKPQRTGVGMQGLIQDFNRIIPIDKIAPLVLERKRTSRTIATFLMVMGSTFMKEKLDELSEVHQDVMMKLSRKYPKFVSRVEL